MKRYKLMIGALVILAALIFGGCQPQYSITINLDGLEQGERVFVLVYPAEGDDIAEIADEDIAGSAVYRDDKDGFVLAEQIPSVGGVDFFGADDVKEKHIDVYFYDKDDRKDFCKKYKTIRIATCDDRWQITNVSKDIELWCTDKHGFVVEGEYDCDTGQFFRKELEKRDYHGMDNSEIYILLLTLAVPADLILFIVLLVFNSKQRPVKDLTLWLTFGLLSLPSLALTGFYIAESTVPYLNVNDDHFGSSDIMILIIMNFTWLMAWGALIIYQVNKGRRSTFDNM